MIDAADKRNEGEGKGNEKSARTSLRRDLGL